MDCRPCNYYLCHVCRPIPQIAEEEDLLTLTLTETLKLILHLT